MTENLVQDHILVEAYPGVHDGMDGVENGLNSQTTQAETDQSTPENGGFVASEAEADTGIVAVKLHEALRVELDDAERKPPIKDFLRKVARPFVAGATALALMTAPAGAATTKKTTKPAPKSTSRTTKTTLRKSITKTGTTGQSGTSRPKVTTTIANRKAKVTVTTQPVLTPVAVDPEGEVTWTDLSPLLGSGDTDNYDAAEVDSGGHKVIVEARAECLPEGLSGPSTRPAIVVTANQRNTLKTQDPTSADFARAVVGTTISFEYEGTDVRNGLVNISSTGSPRSFGQDVPLRADPVYVAERHEVSVYVVNEDARTKVGTLALKGVNCAAVGNVPQTKPVFEAVSKIADRIAGVRRDPVTHRIVERY